MVCLEMTLRQLEILRAVLRWQTTTAAARVLGMSQPAVSNAILQMESQAGFALFERVNNRLYPLEAARLIQEESEPLFAMHAALERRMQDLRDDKVSRLNILSTPPLGHGAIPTALSQFLRGHPRVRSFFNVRELDDVIRGVDSGGTDLGFGLGLGSQPTLETERLFEGRMVCVCHVDDALSRRVVITPADLVGHAFISLAAGTRMGAAVRDAFIAAHQPLNLSIEVHYCNTACDLVEAGLGAAIVDPFSPMRGGRHKLKVLPFEPAIPSVAYAFWSARKPLSGTARRLLQEVRRVLRQTIPDLAAQTG
jgi:DNA-binding transcriptional LysR family regulator